MTWLHFLNDCAEIDNDRSTNASIQSLSGATTWLHHYRQDHYPLSIH